MTGQNRRKNSLRPARARIPLGTLRAAGGWWRNVALFLASDKASYVTGVVAMTMDGAADPNCPF